MTEEERNKRLNIYKSEMRSISQEILNHLGDLHSLKWYQFIKSYALQKKIDLLRDLMNKITYEYSRLLLIGPIK
jgi:hypothetical protein